MDPGCAPAAGNLSRIAQEHMPSVSQTRVQTGEGVGARGWAVEGEKIACMEIGLPSQSVGEFRRHLMHVATSATGKALL